jgi:quercetin dioxygenase-like cupin family protein
MMQIQSTTPQGYVLGAGEGEHLVHFLDAGDVFVGVGPATGSGSFALGTQQVRVGGGIPVHRHWEKDEAFHVLEGSGFFSLNDVSYPVGKGATIFIPRNTWHGFTTPEYELLLLWVMAPAGLDGFFRETCNPPGVPPRQLTRDQIREIGRKYGTEYR